MTLASCLTSISIPVPVRSVAVFFYKNLFLRSASVPVVLKICIPCVQGSRTIRSEEAILVTMAALRPKIREAKK